MYFTDSIWSHTGVFGENGNVFDATTSGVIRHPFADYCDGATYILVIRHPSVSESKRREALEFAESKVGDGYNWRGVILMFFRIIFGAQKPYRMVFFVDALVVALLLASGGYLWTPMAWAASVAFIIYSIVVMTNVLRRRLLHAEA
jgi:hypothetical protein